MNVGSVKGGGVDGSPIGVTVKPVSKVAEDKHSFLAPSAETLVARGELGDKLRSFPESRGVAGEVNKGKESKPVNLEGL